MALKDEVLVMHNNERALLGLNPLEWDDGLEQFAVADASQIATLNTLQHTRTNQNLHMSTKGYLTPSQMVGSWIKEKQYFSNGVFPNIAINGKEWKDVGHYSQIVKRQAKRVGCAMADTIDGRNTVLVCNYDYGNMYGEPTY